MAPELVRGARDITPRADVFSLGCVMFQCLTGRAVFEAEAPTALLAKILLVEAPRVRELAPHVPAAVDDCVARMLAKNPERAAGRRRRRSLDGARRAGAARRRPGRRCGAGAGAATIALTASERRIACVVIAGPSATGERRWSGAASAGRSIPARRRCSPGSCAGCGHRGGSRRAGTARAFTRSPDGSVVVSLPDAGARDRSGGARGALRAGDARRAARRRRSSCRPGRGGSRPGRRSAR